MSQYFPADDQGPPVIIAVRRERIYAKPFEYKMDITLLGKEACWQKASKENCYDTVMFPDNAPEAEKENQYWSCKHNEIWRCEPHWFPPLRWLGYYRWVCLTSWYKTLPWKRSMYGWKVRLPSGWSYTRHVDEVYVSADIHDELVEMFQESVNASRTDNEK